MNGSNNFSANSGGFSRSNSASRAIPSLRDGPSGGAPDDRRAAVAASALTGRFTGHPSPNIYRHHRLHPGLADLLAAVAVETGSACPVRLREQIVERVSCEPALARRGLT